MDEANEDEPRVGGQSREATSVRKLIANRRNAKKSTGPKTPQGKAYSRRNALKHGLFARPHMEYGLLGEDPAEYERLRSELFEEYQPVGGAEELEVEHIVDLWWRLRRVKRYETALVFVAVRDSSRKEIERRFASFERVDVEDDQVIQFLWDAQETIAATGRIPHDFKQKLGEISAPLVSLWPIFESNVAEDLPKLSGRGHNQPELSPQQNAALQTWRTIHGVIGDLQSQRRFRYTSAREIAIAEHIIPEGPKLEQLLRYETTTERSLARAQDRLEKLQNRRWADLVIPARKNRPSR